MTAAGRPAAGRGRRPDVRRPSPTSSPDGRGGAGRVRGRDERRSPRARGTSRRAAHPNDGRVDVVEVAADDGRARPLAGARRACPAAPTCPHPQLAEPPDHRRDVDVRPAAVGCGSTASRGGPYARSRVAVEPDAGNGAGLRPTDRGGRCWTRGSSTSHRALPLGRRSTRRRSAADDVRIRVVASALNHMDLWVTRGMPKPPLPHVPGCDVAGVVEEVGAEVTHVAVGDEVVVNPGVSPVDDIVAARQRQPDGSRLRDLRRAHAGAATASTRSAPGRNVVPRPAGRTWEECAAYPLAYLTAYRMLRRARVAGRRTPCSSSASARACRAPRWRSPGTSAPRSSPPAAARPSASEALAMGADRGHRLGADKWPVEADVVIESVGPATWEQSVRALKPGGRLVVCGGTSGAKVDAQPASAVLQAVSRSSAPRWAATRSSPSSRRSSTRASTSSVDQVLPLDDYPDGPRPARSRASSSARSSSRTENA